MQPSDFLTLLGLAFAVWAIIPHKERNFIFLFFSPFEILLLVLSILFIHFLLSFDWILTNWFPSLSIFTVNKGLLPEAWAYIVSIATVIYPIVKVSYGYFSASRLKNLIGLYNTLLKENELDLLVNYINKYHLLDIKNYLIGLSKLPEKDVKDIILRRRAEKDEAYSKLVKPKRIKFASWVYGHIIQDETFVRSAAIKYPELFAKIFKGMETPKASNEDLVKLYIECLFESKNQSFVSELKTASNSTDSIEERSKHVDIPILDSLFSATKTASKNHIWYPVGEGGVKSLKYDKEQEEFLLREYDSDIKSELWNHKIHIAVVYFNYMVRETIYRDSEWHMWLFYFRHFTDEIIDLLPVPNKYDGDREYPSFAHYLLHQQIWIMLDWLELAQELNTKNRVIDTIRCLGWCINSICKADNSKISPSFKRSQLDLVVSSYFEFSHSPDNIGATTAREWFVKLFLNPKGVDHGIKETPPEYLQVLQDTWEHFDKVPYQFHEDNGSISEFEEKVINPLGLSDEI